MLKLVRKYDILDSGYAYNHLMDTVNQTLVFSHGTTVFVFNWHPRNSIPDYAIPVPEPGSYRIVLTSDAPEFGGYGRIDPAVKAFSFSQTDGDGSTRPYIRIYNLCRSALVLTKINR